MHKQIRDAVFIFHIMVSISSKIYIFSVHDSQQEFSKKMTDKIIAHLTYEQNINNKLIYFENQQ